MKSQIMVGMTIIYKGDKHIIINELCAEDKDVEYSLLYAIRQHTGYKRTVQLFFRTLPRWCNSCLNSSSSSYMALTAGVFYRLVH